MINYYLILLILIFVLIGIIIIYQVKNNFEKLKGKKIITGGGKKNKYNKKNKRLHPKKEELHPKKEELHPKEEELHPKDNHVSGWQLYTLEDCQYCDDQMEELNGFYTYAKFNRSGNNILINNIKGELYPRNKIEGYPFWYNSRTGDIKMGKQNINNLLQQE